MEYKIQDWLKHGMSLAIFYARWITFKGDASLSNV